jgi:hypothetical protein
MGGACSTNGDERNAYRLLVGKPEGKWALGRPRCRWLDNIRMDLVHTYIHACMHTYEYIHTYIDR